MFEPSAADIQFARRFDAVHIGQSSGLDGWLDAIAPQRLSYDFSTRRDVEHYRRIGPKCFLAAVSGGELSPDEITATIACLREAARIGCWSPAAPRAQFLPVRKGFSIPKQRRLWRLTR